MLQKIFSRFSPKPVHFKDEIRRSFIIYALIPSSIFIRLIISISFYLWNTNVSGTARLENKAITAILDQTIAEYTAYAEEPFSVSVASMVSEKNVLASVYSTLKEFTEQCEINANFAVLDSDFSVVMQGSSESTFKIPEYQKSIPWGILGRLKEHPEQTLIEISSEYTASGLDEILVGRSLKNGESNIAGYLVFIVTAKDVMKRLWSVRTPFVITDRYSKVFTSTSQYYVDQFGRILSGSASEEKKALKNPDTAIFTSPVSDGVLMVYTILDISQLRTAIATIVGITIAFLVVLIVGTVISASKIASQKSLTIDQLVAAFRDVEAGILDNRISIETNVEFRMIADAYNKMLDDIKHLIEKNKKGEKEKFFSELKQLEMQFNPHFMYNTLENIKFMIKLDPSAAQQTIVYLSEVLRYSIDNSVSQVCLEDDVKYIENYLFILKARFSKQFSFNIDISDSAKRALVPKLLIQPMIENSVKYGFDMQGALDIHITAQTLHTRIIITVTDNGSGMDAKELSAVQKMLRAKFNSTNHIGLYNVHRRIHLLYGSRYGVDIQSKKGYGTTVRIVLPLKVEKDDTNSDRRR
ncbi:MAG TPA: histidine kinase [Treponemataceae bacterium]|nr:histidine kinase [Treponemataceae bacterium]